jgi:ribosomal 50S subunit-recycling heat shock protein
MEQKITKESWAKSLNNGDKVKVNVQDKREVEAVVVVVNEDDTIKIWFENEYFDIPFEDIEMFERSEEEQQLQPGGKIWFIGERQPMTVKAQSQRYAICTAPFYREKTVYYSILDFMNKWKAPNNLIFNLYDYEDQADIDKSLVDLEAGKYELSKRRGTELKVDWERTLLFNIKNKRKKKNG